MSLVIRFTTIGRRGERKYRVVVKEKRSKRQGDAVDYLGSYEKRIGNKVIENIDREKVKYWISKGAQLSPAVKAVIEAK